jgi:iron(III) transport system substrate-binding protein
VGVRAIIAICFVILIAVPLLFRPAPDARSSQDRDAAELIIITPHNEQIRFEFSRAFNAWHQQQYHQPVNVIWNVPGGTSEIRRMLEAQYSSAILSGATPGGNADLVFGGGSFEHSRLKKGVRIVSSDGSERYEPISAPVDFSTQCLGEMYGENHIGDDPLYDKDRFWFGLALSGFGIVFNRDSLASLGLQAPSRWDDLCDPRLINNVALVNPGQSGSITTAFEAILKRNGWEKGWCILHRAGANARYFSGSSLKPPIDVSQGNAAMGVCIDFFGRYESQVVQNMAGENRVGYIDPIGGSILDSDPISMLRGAPHPVLAKHFIEFCLSDRGQALWQFPRRGSDASPQDELGPLQFELRRLPIRRSMYERYADRMIDKVNPFDLVQPVEHPSPEYRDFIAPLFAAMVMDTHAQARQAWETICAQPEFSSSNGMLAADDVKDSRLRRMLELWELMPRVQGPDHQLLSLSDERVLGAIRAGWLKGGWASANLWPGQANPADVLRRDFADFFRQNYREIVDLGQQRHTE